MDKMLYFILFSILIFLKENVYFRGLVHGNRGVIFVLDLVGKKDEEIDHEIRDIRALDPELWSGGKESE